MSTESSVCVCVRERERERERQTDRQRQRQRQREVARVVSVFTRESTGPLMLDVVAGQSLVFVPGTLVCWNPVSE